MDGISGGQRASDEVAQIAHVRDHSREIGTGGAIGDGIEKASDSDGFGVELSATCWGGQRWSPVGMGPLQQVWNQWLIREESRSVLHRNLNRGRWGGPTKSQEVGKKEDQMILETMCVDGPGDGLTDPIEEKGCLGKACHLEGSEVAQLQGKMVKFVNEVVEGPNRLMSGLDNMEPDQKSIDNNKSSPPVKKKKWKRSARELHNKLAANMMTSPLHRKLATSISAKMKSRRSSLSPSNTRSSPKNSNGKNKVVGNKSLYLLSSPDGGSTGWVAGTQPPSCKRRVSFEDEDGSARSKKLKMQDSNPFTILSAEPVEQARREQ
ncbi:hypothetical protein LWI29_030762 [Acer saccharum]|uniref:Uncharacterized protein n=1 Tax=Acer saccharum TaxID=4024 RepID=A0AA39RP82_ACESA|nr:hypothetical protein LWI29_030762 [Acer saccharum]